MTSGTVVFDDALLAFFQEDRGAFSAVTATEASDGQVTVSSEEKKIVTEHFGGEQLSKYVGNDSVLAAAGLDARREFRLFPTGEIVRPKLKYPKPNNSELRLYFNDDEFKVRKGHYWGVFERAGDIWIFQSKAPLIERLRAGEFSGDRRGEALEEEHDDYQRTVNSNEPELKTTTSKAWARDPKVAAAAIADAQYTCELMPDLPVFMSRASGKPFVEAHHLIPMKMQNDFDQSLDIKKNICVLSPFAHRKIHLVSFDDVVGDIRRLVASRAALLEYANVSEDELLSYYRV